MNRSPAKAPGRSSFSHMGSGACSSWKVRMLPMAKRIAATISGSTSPKASSNSASVTFRPSRVSPSARSSSRPKRTSAASPSVRTASRIGPTFSRNIDRSVSDRRSSAARPAASSSARTWKLTWTMGLPHLDFRKISSPTSRSSTAIAAPAITMKTTETAARSGVMIERIEL